uniref:Dipeptidase n=1 Tax=candidate division WWE3 bacterium TaxID=2053526 RepID=A0A831YZB0_UNCKA
MKTPVQLEKALQYSETRKESFLTELKNYLKIPSISTLSEHQKDIRRATEFLGQHLQNIGMENVRAYSTKGNPVVYADWLHARGKPTLIIYGHYDVQPADPVEDWKSPPFDPQIREGNIYARGATDNKGQHLTHLKALESYLKGAGEIPVNVKVFIEGEEETGGRSTKKFIAENRKLLQADLAILSDGTKFSKNQPTIYIGMRGLVYLELRIRTAHVDAHSGIFGGRIDNAADVLAYLLTNLKDRNGKILIPDFYGKVKDLSKEEWRSYTSLPTGGGELERILGVKQIHTEKGYPEHISGTARPTLDTHGLLSGFTGEGSKTIIPYEATAKVSMRLVPDQNPSEIVTAFKNYIGKLTPPTADVEVVEHASAKPYVMKNKFGISEMKQAQKEVWGKEPLLLRVGGVIGAVADFHEYLGIDTIMADLGDPDDNLHAPNEKFSLENFEKGIAMAIRFLNLIGR